MMIKIFVFKNQKNEFIRYIKSGEKSIWNINTKTSKIE